MVQLHLELQISEKITLLSDKQPKLKETQKQSDEDEFWSDFSDNDFQVDNQLESDQIEIFYNLQTWISSNLDIDFAKLFQRFEKDQHSNLISCTAFMEVLLASGYEFCVDSLEAQTDLMCLIRAISCTQVQNLLSMPVKQHKQSAFQKTEVGFINYR